MPVWLHSQMTSVPASRTVVHFVVLETKAMEPSVVQMRRAVVELMELQSSQSSVGVICQDVLTHCHQMRSTMATTN